MPIFAQMVTVVGFIALVTMIEMGTEGFRPTSFDIAHRLLMAGQHLMAVFCAVGGSVLAEDIR